MEMERNPAVRFMPAAVSFCLQRTRGHLPSVFGSPFRSPLVTPEPAFFLVLVPAMAILAAIRFRRRPLSNI